ncbi:MAG TPA: ABC transporter ATP-binding protein [Chloroflexota bacterium]|nr:ABC transporter ATP-binding protein [Chloroflexota bacterium]
MSAPLLRIAELVVRYDRATVLHGISLAVEPGELVAIIGANGAGKTTTLRAIAGQIPVAGGQIVLAGRDVTPLPAHERARLGIALVPEGRRVFPRLSVEQNLRLGAYTRRDGEVAADLARMGELFPVLAERARQPAGTLSGGEQQMLAIARALMARPRIVLMDEPSMGLAPRVVTEIYRIIGSLKRMGTTILLVEQNARKALRVADRGYVLETGRLTLEAPAAALAADPRVQRAYLGVHA